MHPEDALAAQAKLGPDLRAANADGGITLPMPTVVVDAAGTIRFVDVHPDYTTRTEVSDIVAAVSALHSQPDRSERNPMGNFDGRRALVTGSGRGIGQAIAVDLARSGADLILVARSADQLAETATMIAAHGRRTRVLPADLADGEQLEGLLDDVDGVDMLVNNAAVVTPIGAATTIDVDAWATALRVNAVAAARLTYGFLPTMIDTGWGRIVNVSALIAARPAMNIGMNAYATSKAALEAHTLNLAAELHDTGVTVNVYRPGTVDTAMQTWIRAQDPDSIGTELHDRFVGMDASGALITPAASAHSMVARLASDDTGQIWDVNDHT